MTTDRPASRAAILEAVSKGASLASVVLILLLQLGLNPDITWSLRALAAAAMIVGWGLPIVAPDAIGAVWLFAAPLVPAIVGRLAHREGPVLDLVWMAGLAASLIRTTNWSRWSLPASWRPLVGGWALALSLAWPVLVARELAFDPRIIADAGAINTWARLSAAQVSTWITFVALTQILGALWLDGVMDRIASRPRAIRDTAVALGAGVTLASLVAIYQGTVDFSFLSTANWTSLHRATGTLMDANAYGVIAAIGGVLGFLGLRVRRRRAATATGLAMLAVSFAGMWMSASRTALLCGLGGAAGLIAAAVLRRGLNLKRTVPLAVALAIVAAVALASGSLGVGPLRRLHEMPWGYTSELASLVRRGGYGTVALQMVRDYPLTGVGVGSFNFMAADYWRSPAYSLPFDNAQNWWRHEAAEMGLLGGLAIVGWSLVAGWVLLTRRLAPEGRFTAVALRGALLGIAACSMLGMPTQNPIVLLTFFLAVGWLATLVLDPELPVVSRHSAAAWVVVTLLAVGYAGGHLWLARHSLSVASRAVRWNREYVVGAYPPEPMTGGSGEFRWTRARATFLWPTRPGVLLVHIWASNPDIVQHPVNISLSMPCGVLMNETLRSGYPLELAFEVPEGQAAVEASIRVSRTWRPAEMLRDNGDRRALGVAVWHDWGPPEEAKQASLKALPACPAIP